MENFHFICCALGTLVIPVGMQVTQGTLGNRFIVLSFIWNSQGLVNSYGLLIKCGIPHILNFQSEE